MSTDHCECGEKIIRKSENGDVAIRNRIVLIKSNGDLVSICPHCKKENIVAKSLDFKVDSLVIVQPLKKV